MSIETGYRGNGEGPMAHATRMVQEAKALKDSIGTSAGNLRESIDLRGRVQRHPFGMLLAAAGAGYVLGGGLFSPLTKKLVKVGVRLALIPLVRSQLEAVAGEAFAGMRAAAAEPYGAGGAGPRENV